MDTYPIIDPQIYWKDKPGTCGVCKHARPRFNAIEYGGGQLDNYWCEKHQQTTVNHGCGSYEREPGVEG